jgi:hypothetical protein
LQKEPVRLLQSEPSPGYGAPFCASVGEIVSSFQHPEDYDLWVSRATFAEGAEILWEGDHGDEVIYVRGGLFDWCGEACGPGTAVVVESGARGHVRALVGGGELVHFGSGSVDPPTDGPYGAPDPENHGAHVVATPTPLVTFTDEIGTVRRASTFADSSCSTCRLTLLDVQSDGPGVSPSHAHSQDEIIFLLEGEMQVGRVGISAGQAIAVPADRRYGYRTKGAYEFLNYRKDASYYTRRPGDAPHLESSRALG